MHPYCRPSQVFGVGDSICFSGANAHKLYMAGGPDEGCEDGLGSDRSLNIYVPATTPRGKLIIYASSQVF